MLNTFKQLKGTLNLNLYFAETLSANTDAEKFSLVDQTKMTQEWINTNKDNIKKYLEETAKKSWAEWVIWLEDFENNENSVEYKNFVSLLTKLWVAEAKMVWVSEILKNLENFKSEAKETKKISTKQRENISENTNKSVIDNFDVSKDKKDSIKVVALQTALNANGEKLKVDGIFWPRTKAALNRARGIEETVVAPTKTTKRKPGESVLVSGNFKTDKVNVYSEWTESNDETPLNEEGQQKTLDDARKSVETAKWTLDEFRFRIEATREVNKMLGDYTFASNRGFSIENLIRYLTKTGKYNEVAKIAKTKSDIFHTKEGKQKIENAIALLRRPNDSKENDDTWTKMDNSNILNNILKAAPWLFGIYLGDIPLPVMKKMLPGVDLDKSVPFKEWLDSGMPGEFKDYLKTKPARELEPIKDLISLRAVLSKTNLTSQEQARVLSGDLTGLDDSTKKLVISYIKELLVPNLRILKEDSFVFVTRLFKNTKHSQVHKLLEELNSQASSWNLAWYEKKVSEVIRILRLENDTDMKTVDKVEAWDKYISRISGHNAEVQKLNELSKLWDRAFNDYNRIFALTNINSLFEMWISTSDQDSLWTLLRILNSTPINEGELLAWEKSNPSTYNFIKSLGNKEAMKKYQLNSIPRRDGLNYVEVWSDYQQQRKHGRDLSKLSNAEALRAAESETPERGSDISTLGFAYKTFIEQGDISGISYEDFRNAFANKTNVDINSLTQENIYNTWRAGTNKLTSFSELAAKGDKEVFKLAPIEKSYSYYEEDGKEVTVRVSYDLYLRTDCTNPLIVPNTIKATKEWKVVPEGKLISLAQTKRKLPVVIPWALFIKPKTPTPEKISTLTWDNITRNWVWTWNIVYWKWEEVVKTAIRPW